MSTEQHKDPPSPPALHISPMAVVGGKEEGGSHERCLWCCRRSCYAVTQICEGTCSGSSAIARTTSPVLYFTPLYFFLFSLLYGAAIIPTFKPCSLCFSHSLWCGTSVVTLGDWARSGQAMARPHQTAWTPLSSETGFCSFRTESHFWCCHITVARIPVKRCIQSPERFWLEKKYYLLLLELLWLSSASHLRCPLQASSQYCSGGCVHTWKWGWQTESLPQQNPDLWITPDSWECALLISSPSFLITTDLPLIPSWVW